jgi:hypothetical protein
VNNYTERRKYKRVELGKKKYKEILAPYIARFRVKQYCGREMPPLGWNIVAVKNLSPGGIKFDYYKMNLGFGTLIDLKIDFIKSIPTINCIGRIIRIEEKTQYNSMFRIATEFTEIDDKDREIINITIEAILRKEERKEARKKTRSILCKIVRKASPSYFVKGKPVVRLERKAMCLQ